MCWMVARLSIVSLQSRKMTGKDGGKTRSPTWTPQLNVTGACLLTPSTKAPITIHLQIRSFPRQVCAALIGNSNRGLQANNCDRQRHWGMWNDDIGLTLKAGFYLCKAPQLAVWLISVTWMIMEKNLWTGITLLMLEGEMPCGAKGLLWCITSFRYFSASFDCIDMTVWVCEAVIKSNYEIRFCLCG